nr:MAG TPA: Protein of unknown function (DUF1811) [Caudoviricetes sp.]
MISSKKETETPGWHCWLGVFAWGKEVRSWERD